MAVQAEVKGFLADSVKDFECTMAACEDNCCRNTSWNIFIDPVTYEKYKNMDNDIGKHIMDCIEEMPDNKQKFKEFDHGHCPLLTPEGLCYVHRNLGAEYLCVTCSTYPRVWDSFYGRAEYWLSLSCPDAIRHALYKRKKITFVEAEITLNHALPTPKSFEPEKFKIREFLIAIVQYRKFSLKEKLIFMGLFMRSISKFPLDATFNKNLDDVMRAYRDQMRKPKFLSEMINNAEAIHPDNRVNFFQVLNQAAFASSTPPKKLPEGIRNEDYYKLVAKFHQDVKDGAAEKYLLDAFDRLIVPYVNSNAYVFENYLAYSLVSSKFLPDAEDFSAAYAGFAGEFLTMLAFVAGVLHENEALTHDEMIAGMYLFHRKVSHTKALRDSLAKSFSDSLFNMLLGALGGIR